MPPGGTGSRTEGGTAGPRASGHRARGGLRPPVYQEGKPKHMARKGLKLLVPGLAQIPAVTQCLVNEATIPGPSGLAEAPQT